MAATQNSAWRGATDGVVLPTVATLNALTASGSCIARGAYRALALTPDFAPATTSRYATVPHTNPYAWLTPTANDSASTLRVGRSDPG